MKSSQDTENNDDMREEYDFSSKKGGVRATCVGSLEKSVVAVLLDSDVAEVFHYS